MSVWASMYEPGSLSVILCKAPAGCCPEKLLLRAFVSFSTVLPQEAPLGYFPRVSSQCRYEC